MGEKIEYFVFFSYHILPIHVFQFVYNRFGLNLGYANGLQPRAKTIGGYNQSCHV